MSETPSEADANAAHDADRAPTTEEVQAADEAARALKHDGELDEVSDNYKEAIERGANVKGEGEI